jgi:glycosyltransferase involved in cell wall biosynthesis
LGSLQVYACKNISHSILSGCRIPANSANYNKKKSRFKKLKLKKKIILLFTDWFAPGYKAGGPIQSCLNLVFALKNEYNIYVFTSDTDHGESKPYKGIETNIWLQNLDVSVNVYYSNSKTFSVSQIKEQIQEVKPDYVYLNHMFSPRYVLYPLWLKFNRTIKCKVILCPRGALYSSALSVKSYKKKPFLWIFKWLGLYKKILFHATNKREQEAIASFFPGASTIIANNLPVTKQDVLLQTEKKAGSLRLLFIARIHPIKNLLFLLRCLYEVKSEIALTIVGPLEDEAYWQLCKEQIKLLPVNIAIKFLGPKENHALQPILTEHHLFVLPTRGENFGHSIFESFLAGRPVLISDQTPWLDLHENKAGWSISLDRPEEFLDVIEAASSWDQNLFDVYCKNAWQYAQTFLANPHLLSPYYKLFS